jgi:hypothetical protein
LQIDEPNRFAIGKIDEFLRPELGQGTANRFERGSDMIRYFSPRKLNSERIRTLRIGRKMCSNAQKQPCYASHAILLAHGQDKRQRIRQNLMGAARFITTAQSGDLRPQYPTIRDSLGGELLTSRLGWHYDVARPIKCQNLAITVLKKPDGAYDTLHDFYFVGFFVAFPEECASARNQGRQEIALLLTVAWY